MHKKAAIFFFSLLLLLGGLGLGHRALLSWAVEAYLNATFPSNERFHCRYERSDWEGRVWVFHGLHIERGGEEHFDARIEAVHLRFDLHPSTFFTPQVTLHRPHVMWERGEQQGEWRSFVKEALFKSRVEVSEAELCCGKRSLYFNFIPQRKGREGLLTVGEVREVEAAALHFSKEGEEIAVKGRASALSLPWLLEVGRFFALPLDPRLTIREGSIEGQLSFRLSSSFYLHDFSCSGTLRALALHHKGYGVELALDQLSCGASKVGNGESRGEVEGLHLVFEEEESGRVWNALDMNGSFSYGAFERPLLTLSGVMGMGESALPTQLTCEGRFEKGRLASIAAEARLFAQEEERKLSCALHFDGEERGSAQLQAECLDLSADELGLIQAIVQRTLPPLKRWKMERGWVSMKGEGRFEGGALKRFEVRQLEGRELELSLPVAMQLSSIQGAGEFDLSTPDLWDASFWELQLTDGSFTLKEGQRVEQLNLKVGMQDRYFTPSSLSARLGEVEGTMLFEGLYSALNVEGRAHFAAPSSTIDGLDLSFILKSRSGLLMAEGECHLLEEGKRGDMLTFGLNGAWEALLRGELRASLGFGWFKGEALSAEALNLPLSWGECSFRGRGSATVEGTFNGNHLELTLDPTHLSYHSPAVTLTPPKTEQKLPNCIFIYQFGKGEWRGKIPLRGVEVQEHFFGLPFETLSSEVVLEGKKLLFRDVEATSGGVHFNAEMELEFLEGERELLTIETTHIQTRLSDAFDFLGHFDTFKAQPFPPMSGAVTSGEGGMRLRAHVGAVRELLEWQLVLSVSDGVYPFSSTFGLKNIAGEIIYSAEDERIQAKNVAGELHLLGGESPKSYLLKMPLLEWESKRSHLRYDCRLDSPTYEVCRIFGEGNPQEEGEFALTFDQEWTRLFGAQVDVERFTFKEGRPSAIALSTTLSALELTHHIDFLSNASLMPLPKERLRALEGTQQEGEVALRLDLDCAARVLLFEMESSHLRMGAVDLDHLSIKGERRGGIFQLSRCDVGAFKGSVTVKEEGEDLRFSQLECSWKESHLKGGEGLYDRKRGQLSLPLEELRLSIEELLPLLPLKEEEWSHLSGLLTAEGVLTFDLSRGIKKWAVEGALQLTGSEMGRAKLQLNCPKKVQIALDGERGLTLKGGEFHLFHPRSPLIWAQCWAKALILSPEGVAGEGVRLLLPPEMVHLLAQTRSLPHLSGAEEHLDLLGFSFKWDNQIDTTFDFSFGEKNALSGQLKEGYYWVVNEPWQLSPLHFHYQNSTLDMSVETAVRSLSFDVAAHLSFAPHFTSKLTIQEKRKEQVLPFVLQTDWNENEGFFIQTVSGTLCGIECDLHHNPRDSFLDEMALKGQLKIHPQDLSLLLPSSFQEMIKKLELGRGYELSGDLILSKVTPEASRFDGYLKGKNFQLMGSTFETLLSSITIQKDHLELSHLKMSDTAGMLSIPSLQIKRCSGSASQLFIPELLITDFRPSLIKKSGKYPSRIKPLTIQNCALYDLQGELGNLNSFVGKGQIQFINTFKRDYHIFDIPFEILGRLGLDMGLLVPVKGELSFVLVEGRFYLTQLSNSYSEGKRSQFFLSPLSDSFIDLQGNIHVNIKMKQYVLLKVTEPFTLSIGGTLENPKYGLR